MIMSKIILRENVENNNNQSYPVSDLIIIIFIFVFRSCYYFLMKLIQLFVSYCSTAFIKNKHFTNHNLKIVTNQNEEFERICE